MINIEKLKITVDTDFKVLKEKLANIDSIKIYIIADNSAKKVKLLEQCINEGVLAHVISLSLRRNGLESLPDNIGRLESLQVLDLSRNNLKSLPKSISKLVDLRALTLESNNFNSFPEVIYEFRKLQELCLFYNKLTVLPASIGNLEQLHHLDIGFNQLKSLPKSISRLNKLQLLNLSGNRFELFPEVICELVKLQVLWFCHNKNSISLPESISRFSQLLKLNLLGNKLTKLPTAIGDLEQLQELYISVNKLTDVKVDLDLVEKSKNSKILFGENFRTIIQENLYLELINARLIGKGFSPIESKVVKPFDFITKLLISSLENGRQLIKSASKTDAGVPKTDAHKSPKTVMLPLYASINNGAPAAASDVNYDNSENTISNTYDKR